MNISDLEKLGFKPLQSYEDKPLLDAYCGDLLSDVVANAPGESVLVTIQGHKNTIAVASLVGIQAVVIVNGSKVDPDMLTSARDEKVALFSTPLDQVRTTILISKYLP